MSASCQPSLRHSWSSEERKALLLLKDDYHLPWEILTPVFNYWLDVQQGLRQPVLYAQYIYISRPPTNVKQMNAQNTFSSAEQDLGTLYLELERTGLKLGIKMHRQFPKHDSEDSQIHNDALKRKRSSGTLHTESEETNVPAASSSKKQRSFQNITAPKSTPSQLLNPRTPPPTVRSCHIGPANSPSPLASPTLAIRSVRRKLSSTVHSLVLPISTPQITPSSLEELPLIGFRGFSDRSQGLNSPQGFRAGAFMGAANIPLCPAVTDASFIAEATFHVGWTKGHPSPFISITTSCIRAIMKSRSPKSGRYLAVLDLHKIERSSEIFSAQSLDLKPTKLNGAPINYHSGGEYLIWGVINTDAIISVVPIESLVSPPPKVLGDPDPFELEFISTAWRRVAIRCIIAKNGRMTLSYQAGIAVGEFIRRLQLASNYNVAATSLIVTDWQFDVRKGESWQENSIFCQGLNLGLKETGQVQHTDTGNHISQAVIMEHEVPTNQEDSDDYVSLLEQLELAMSETPEESNDKVINIEHRKETALTNSGQGDHNKGSDRGKITEARVASNEGPAFSTDEKFVVVSATSSSSASQENEKTTDEAEVAWSSWMGM